MVFLVVFFTIFQSNNLCAFELEMYFEKSQNGYNVSEQNYKKIKEIYKAKKDKISDLEKAIQNERNAVDKIIKNHKNKIQELEKELNEKDEKMDEIRIQIEKERLETDKLIQVKIERINNLELQIKKLESVNSDLNEIIENKNKIISNLEDVNEIVELKSEKIINIYKALNEANEQQSDNYKKLYENSKSAKSSINWVYVAFLGGLLAGIYAQQ